MKRSIYSPCLTMSVAAMLLFVSICAAAQTSSDEEFVALFDGKTFQGWYAADRSWWSIQDGAITATITQERPCQKNQYLFYEPHLPEDADLALFDTKGQMFNFELKLTHRILSPHTVNGGFQYRSEHYLDGDCKGYQIDNNTNTPWLARMYDEFGRHTLAWRGERTRYDAVGKRHVQRIESVPEKAHFSLDKWHEYHLICRGTHMTLTIDGELVGEVFDEQPSDADLSGLFAPQLHSGPPMVVQFKDILYRPLPKATPVDQQVDAKQAVPDAEPSQPPKSEVGTDKTLVAWVCPATLDQGGGTVLTVQSGSEFDGLVFAERSSAKWMVGSHSFKRTNLKQDYAAEKLTGDKCYQMATVYQGNQITLYRDGKVLDSFTTSNINLLDRPDLILVIGKRHLGAAAGSYFQGAIDDARIYRRALTQAELASLKPNEASAIKPLAWWDFEGDRMIDRAGRFGHSLKTDGVELADGRLVLDGNGYLVAAGSEDDVKKAAYQDNPRAFGLPYTPETPAWPEDPPANWHTFHLAHPGPGDASPGDPNCVFDYKGRYHLHYIYRNHTGFTFAHVSSDDLVQWKWHPTVLAPPTTGHGMFSGTGFYTTGGKPAIIYHGQGSGRNWIQYPLDDQFNSWSEPVPVLPKTADGDVPNIRHWDPDCWLNGDTYYALSGGKSPQLMKSTDLANWTYLGDLLHEDYPADLGVPKDEDISCANMFKIGDRWMLLCISHGLGCRYYLGNFKDEKYLPEFHAMMSWNGNQFFAPESMLTRDGRRVMWAWLLRMPIAPSGVQSLPRELELPADGVLRIRPLRELASLRFDETSWSQQRVKDGAECAIDGLSGDAMELELAFASPVARECGVHLLADDGGQDGISITVDSDRKTLKVGAAEAPFVLNPHEDLTLRVFIDKNLVEVFANDRQAVAFAHKHLRENPNARLFAKGGDTVVDSIKAWKMKTIYQQPTMVKTSAQ